MKRRLLPQRINLLELPSEGRDFCFDREGGELNVALLDLIGANPYRIEFNIQPMGNIFLLKGRVETELDLLCSRCGIDFKQKINESVSEILMIEESPMGRGDTTSRVNHTSDLSDQTQEATLLSGPQFDVGEFFHEIIGLAEPIQPLGGKDCETSCENLQEAYNRGWLSRPDAASEIEPGKHRPFSGLKGLKLN
jgi:uncharacterized metal-binding protein YceD (DUF177 family)